MASIVEFADVREMPAPPRLHWLIVFLLSVVTYGLFVFVWILVLGLWLRKINGRSRALYLLMAYVGLYPALLLVTIAIGLLSRELLMNNQPMILGVFQFLSYALFVAMNLMLMGELGTAPIGLRLRGIPAMFFGPAYFQYRLSHWVKARAEGTIL